MDTSPTRQFAYILDSAPTALFAYDHRNYRYPAIHTVVISIAITQFDYQIFYSSRSSKHSNRLSLSLSKFFVYRHLDQKDVAAKVDCRRPPARSQ